MRMHLALGVALVVAVSGCSTSEMALTQGESVDDSGLETFLAEFRAHPDETAHTMPSSISVTRVAPEVFASVLRRGVATMDASGHAHARHGIGIVLVRAGEHEHEFMVKHFVDAGVVSISLRGSALARIVSESLYSRMLG